MELRLIREPSAQETTLGVLFLNKRFYGFTLEDEVREVQGAPVSSWKVQDKTAIPIGRYEIKMGWSIHFNRRLPHLQDVPGFTGILIHPGNTNVDTKGCILLGVQRTGVRLVDSRILSDALNVLLEAEERKKVRSWITVEGEVSHA